MLKPHEAEILAEVINTVCSEGHWMLTTHFVITPAWERVLTGPFDDTHLLLIVFENGPVGWCRLFPTDHPKEGEIGIGLLPTYRDQGKGTYLVRQAIAWATERDFARLTLTTRADNDRAIHVFEKCGFEFTGVQDGIWLQMALHLHNSTNGSEAVD